MALLVLAPANAPAFSIGSAISDYWLFAPGGAELSKTLGNRPRAQALQS